jgi:hypothetical protein
MQKRPAPRRIGSRAIITTNITQNAVTSDELAPDSVTPTELAPDSVTADAIAPGTITDTELADGAGGAKTSFSTAAPTNPAIGDVWFDSNDSLKLKRWSGTAWVSMRDLGIAAAAAGADAASAAATAAQNTANSKNKVYRQTTEPTGGTYAEGDLWFDTDDNNKIYRRTGAAWTAVQLGGEALANINANKITAGSIDASVITVSNLDAGNITAGTIAAARITSTSISAANITAAQITSGEISSARITSDSISAASINADNITAGRINAGGVLIGNDIVMAGHYGVSLATDNFDNIFLKRNDGAVFFRVDTGSGHYIKFENGSLNISALGTVNFGDSVSIGNSCFIGNSLYTGNNVRVNQGTNNPKTALNTRGDSSSDALYYALVAEKLNGVNILEARCDGKVLVAGGSSNISATSDIRSKKDIEDIEVGLDLINSLRPVSYIRMDNFQHLMEEKEDFVPEYKEDREYGLIAQEVKQLIDDGKLTKSVWDETAETGSQSLAYMALIAPMIKAIQELSAKVKELESNQ